VKACPACRSELPDDAVACAHCGGSYQPDGSFTTPFDAEMAAMAAEREKKVERAEGFGRLGKPIPHWFLDDKSGCLITMLPILALLVAAGAAAAV
jgi:hypothetical protein